MISIDKTIWNLISKPSGEQLVARNVFPDKTNYILCALDSNGQRHLLIVLNKEDKDYQDIKSKGFRVKSRDLVIKGENLRRYLDIECLDSSGYSIFDIICSEIIDDLLNEQKNPVDIVKAVLSKWRRFWGQLPQQVLSKEEQIGLFAELWFLSVWLIPKCGIDSIHSWRGPWGSRHDFELEDKSVEVKATLNTRGRLHRINGLDQLENPEKGSLYFFSLRLREEPSSSNNLTTIIGNCYTQLSDSPDCLDHFESALIRIGYSPLYNEIYSKLKLHIIEENLFIVKDNFPRILNSSFVSGIPSGVEKIEYDLNLNTFDHLIVCRNPSQLPFCQVLHV